MKLKTRLTIIIAAMIIVIMALLLTVIIIRAWKSQSISTYENMKNMTRGHAIDTRRSLSEAMDTARTMAQMLSGFRQFDENVRRPVFTETFRSLMFSNTRFVGMGIIFRPNTIDDRGEYCPLITRKTGELEEKKYSIARKKEYDQYLANLRNIEIISEPYPMEVDGKSTWLVDLSSPIVDDDTAEVCGVVVVFMDIGKIQEQVTSLHPYETGLSVMISGDVTIVSHYNEANIGKHFKDTVTGRELGEEGSALLEQSLAKGEYNYSVNNGMICVNYPFYVGSSKKPWTLLTAVPEATVFKGVYDSIYFAIITGILATAAASVIVFIIVHMLTKPIVKVSRTLKDISEGEGDLTRTVAVHSRDEVGDLAGYFNQTLEKIRGMVVTIKGQTGVLLNIGDDLARSMQETASSINQITANTNNIRTMTDNQRAEVEKSNAVMEKINAAIHTLNTIAVKQSESMAKSSAAIEQMIANIQSVTKTLAVNAQSVESLAEASGVGRAGLDEVAFGIQEIARQSEGLGAINSVMENISGQTNLLSMNAAIEAAHAGEAGKGFAVVANEIRKLAEDSGEQSKTISAVLKKITDSIDTITTSTENVLKKFGAIDGGIKTVSEQTENIRRAMEEQSTGSRQILESIGELDEITRQVRECSAEMFAGSQEITAESAQLGRVTDEITSGMHEMTAGTNQINAAVNRINEISGENRKSIEILAGEVARFRVE